MLNNYIKLALKVLGRRKFFTFISLFGISLTLVVLMVATAILDNIFAARAPETRMSRALGVYTIGLYGEGGGMTSGPGYGFLDKYVRGLPSAEAVSIYSSPSSVVMYSEGRKIETYLKRTDGAYWQILDFQFVEGAPFTQADDEGGRFVAVISEDLRRTLFGGETAVGKSIDVDSQRFRVIGVVRSVPSTRYTAFSQVWAPIGTMKSTEYKKQTLGSFNGLVLARSRGDFARLREEFNDRISSFQPEDKRFNTLRAGLDTSFEAFARAFTGNKMDRRAPNVVRLVFLIAALLFITLPTVNLVSINLSRIMERAAEIGVRKAFGASSRALVAQFIIENVVLTVLGGIAGFILASGALLLLNRAGWIPFATFDINFRIFGYGMLLAAMFGVISGAYPAWRMSRMQPVAALRGA